ncbi:hypothetical protein [Qipengyuania gaetbuli]|uniref:hypothetical protein n=1 Tax=Qipengyuania gaetbuli TaxID=266952 RepID=UPI001CD7D024|nr:hypothetical protein [Qipengyuania gaetbuli]MCA0910069.1 hypothetical protein [Qipengyuania gaetbuli]
MDIEPDEETRAIAAEAYWAAEAPFQSSRDSADARERIRNIKSQAGIDGLEPRLRQLWDWHVKYQRGFSEMPFEMQKAEFLFLQVEEAVPELEIPAPYGRRGYDAYQAAAVPLLAWWEAGGNRVTANRGRAVAKEGRKQPKPSAAVSFLAAEFRRITPDLGDRALDVAFKVAQRHIRNRTTLR